MSFLIMARNPKGDYPVAFFQEEERRVADLWIVKHYMEQPKDVAALSVFQFLGRQPVTVWDVLLTPHPMWGTGRNLSITDGLSEP